MKPLLHKGKPIGLGVFAGALGVALAASPAFAAGGWSVVPAPPSPGGNDMLNAVAAVSETEAWTVGTTFTAPDANSIPVPKQDAGRHQIAGFRLHRRESRREFPSLPGIGSELRRQ